jgi:membrane-associated phospholipid phosphatase
MSPDLGQAEPRPLRWRAARRWASALVLSLFWTPGLTLPAGADGVAPIAPPAFIAPAAAAYPSDTPPNTPKTPANPTGDHLVALLAPFSDIPTDGPEPVLGVSRTIAGSAALKAWNDIVAVQVNTAATPDQVEAALTDATADPALAIADGFGPTLGPLFAEALRTGALPLTANLLGGRVGRGLAGYQRAKATFAYPRPFVRLGFTGAGGFLTRTPSSEYAKLRGNGSFPSGHTLDGYLAGTLLASLAPEFAPGLLARAADFAHHRIVLGVHYPLDVMAGRVAAQRIVQLRWSDAAFRPLLTAAAEELHTVLAARCRAGGHSPVLTTCADDGAPRLTQATALATYTERLSYALPGLRPATEPCAGGGATLALAAVPPGAEDLLLTAHPSLTAAQRREVLAATALEPGLPLDTRTGQASWVRLNLAAAMSATVDVDPAGHATVRPLAAGTLGRGATRPKIAAVTASQTTVTLVKGSSYTIPTGAYGTDGSRLRPSFTSGAPAIASVSRTGEVKAHAQGKATIRFCAGNRTAKVTVTVRNKRPAASAVTRVVAKRIPKRMTVGQAASASATYQPTSAVAVKVRYSSSRPSVLAVDKAGRMVARRPGTAIITVKAGIRQDRVRVRVH